MINQPSLIYFSYQPWHSWKWSSFSQSWSLHSHNSISRERSRLKMTFIYMFGFRMIWERMRWFDFKMRRINSHLPFINQSIHHDKSLSLVLQLKDCWKYCPNDLWDEIKYQISIISSYLSLFYSYFFQPLYFNHGPAIEMWSVVHFPFA